ncbi:hypothetical protein XENOCAPTIV_025136 [Xenoophorus captivus]|uniref:Uncharacterized protein n=1 Tax=Xenoophorus captivus TaxID=1517983 RepID=A0ABV0SAX9_9TELE
MAPPVTGRCPSPKAAKQSQSITLPPPCLTVDMFSFFLKQMLLKKKAVLLLKFFFSSTADVTGHTFRKVSLLSSLSTEYFPKSTGPLRRAFVFFWVLELLHEGHFCPVSVAHC